MQQRWKNGSREHVEKLHYQGPPAGVEHEVSPAAVALSRVIVLPEQRASQKDQYQHTGQIIGAGPPGQEGQCQHKRSPEQVEFQQHNGTTPADG